MNEHHRGIDFSGIRAANPIADTIGRYLQLTKRGGEYLARCPFHNDSNPSFAVVPKKEKAFCNACSWHGDVIDFVAAFDGISTTEAARKLSNDELPRERPALPPLPPDEADEWQPILPAPDSAPLYDPAKTYNPRRGKTVNWSRALTRADEYRDAAGRLLGYVVRMDIDGAKLTPTVTWCRHADGRECWASAKFPSPRPLQGLDELARRPDTAVLVVSGEKCREAAAHILPGFVAVTWPGGDNNVDKADWMPLAGRRVTIWPDADPSGWQAAQTLAGHLWRSAAEVRVIAPDGQAKGWDIADAVADGWDRARIVEWVKPRVSAWVPEGDDPGPSEGEPAPFEPDPRDLEVATAAAPALDTAKGAGTEPVAAAIAGGQAIILTSEIQANGELVSRRPDRLTILSTTATPATDLDNTVDSTEDDLPEKFTEDNVALAFSQRYADDFRYVAPWGRWMMWEGQRWVPDETRYVHDKVRATCRGVAVLASLEPHEIITAKQKAAIGKTYGLASTISSVERLATSDRRHAATIEQWDADIWLLNTPAGVVDLRTGSITPGSRAAHMTKITSVAPGGACPTWHAFLQTTTGGDLALIQFLQRMCGYALTGSTRDHALFFVYGSGGNGKGTFLNTLQWIMGDYAKAAPADMFTERKHEAHTTELARLMGARLVAAQETEEGKRWAEAKIKALTGGDPITARFMRQDDFQFIPQFKLVMTGNHKPGLRNVDEAIKRRLHLIPFTVTIPPEQRDQKLGQKMQAEAGGILQWAIEGCIAWQRDGLQPPPSVVAATDEYLEQQDVLGLWIDECCDVSASHTARRGDLYKSFKAWAEGAGEYVLPQKRWVAAIETRGVKSRLSGGIQYCDGIRVKSVQVAKQDQWTV